MKFCYHSFLRWLSLWLSPDVSMYDHLTDASYEDLAYEFWAAIAPNRDETSPWEIERKVKEHCLFDLMEGTNDMETLRYWVRSDVLGV